VAMTIWMPAARAICARRWMAPFDFLAGDHHQVGHFVDDDDEHGHRLVGEFLALIDRFAGVFVKPGLDGAADDLALLRPLSRGR
jgi:hypothetical protein